MHNYFYNPCTAYCASSTPKNNRVGVTTLIYFMRWTYIINQYNHYKNNFAHLLVSKSATNSLKQIYRTCLITVCFVHNVPSFFAIIVLTLWYIRNTSGMIRGLFGIPSVRAFWRNDTFVFTLLWQNAAFNDILLSLQQQAIVIVLSSLKQIF